MSSTILNVQKLGKCYASYRSNLLRYMRWFGIPVSPQHEYWAVKDVSFTLRAGEALALIGQNGAGKSTLLKLITGTVRPTTGNIAVLGRISAILELGLGFNPEFTGRQNVYLAGGLMGLSTRQIDEIIPAIEDFSELGEFFDQPLRVYSSGMQARLAFSVATAVRPDVLIVDEVLSVGDSYFQHKSFDKIRKFKEEGTSILLVTHSMGDVRALCDRVILLDKGKILKDGPPDEVVDYYNAMIAEKENARLSVEQKRQKNGWFVTRSGNFQAKIKSLVLLDEMTQEPVEIARVGQRLVVKLVATINEDIPRLVLGYMLRDRTGHVVWGTNTWHTEQVLNDLKKGEEVEFYMPFTCTLGPGSYSFTYALTSSDTHLENNYEWVDNALVFDVINADKKYFIGTSWLDAVFQISRR
ncbi:sugar ABC transporter ATP-binding protein [Desulforamulus profundi]|uniref:Sugar ABC transporter ATP-binding protein n=1 Tax=Desulforamulus profundi TaxID=1383067 RepID=A0A2C6MEL6_9FIRM|nr:ABC transporter ATP-binding protein [Desulforamulus profundi]PHJ39769.1 sugar ABC transporter ATP-binding protein [Desulforamulus profundi]